jgi:mono/diheme cytochrome c family protein
MVLVTFAVFDTCSRFPRSVAGLTLSCALLAWAHGTSAHEATPEAVYLEYCSVCHGENGDGKSRASGSMMPPPRDFTTPAAAVDLTRPRMISSIADGRPGTAMVAWKHQLDADQIAAVADYIRERFMLAVSSEDAARAQGLYATYCSVCHGERGQVAMWAGENMSPPPRDFTSSDARRVLSRERMIRSVTYGRANTAMPGWGSQLGADDIESIVDYIRLAFMPPEGSDHSAKAEDSSHAHADSHAAGVHAHDILPPGQILPDMSLPFPGGVIGNADRGRKFYDDNCATCHGTAGDGRGPRAYFIMPKPRDFTHAATRHSMNRPALFESISMGTRGTEMAAWSKVIDAQTIADVAEYVLQEFIRPGEIGGADSGG